MSKLRSLLRLELIGWVLIVLALFGLPSFGVKWGALLILVCHLSCALGWECKWCEKTGTCFRKKE